MEYADIYDLAVAWNWEYDGGFVGILREAAFEQKIRLLEIRDDNVELITGLAGEGKIGFRYLLDRASDEDEKYRPIVRYAAGRYAPGNADSVVPINLPDLQRRAADKATMHLEFLSHNIDVPYTIIISPFSDSKEVEISIAELARLGRPFIIKPANNTGGGVGVVMGAETLKEVIDARQFNASDKYLLQETVRPLLLGGKRGWFRVFYAFGDIIPCWWDDLTHVYSPLPAEEESEFGLRQLRLVTARIYEVCRLDFFSTELAYVSEEKCIAVDYVNELCDMRLQSQSADGVPDVIVKRIVARLIGHVKKNTSDPAG
jgi:hypothetical protein